MRARALPLLGDVCVALQLPGEAAIPRPDLRIHCPPLAQWVATTLRQWAAAGDTQKKRSATMPAEHVELPVVWAALRCVSYAGLDAAAVRDVANSVLQRAHRLTDAAGCSDPALLILAAEAMAVVRRSWGAEAAVGQVAAAVPAALQRVAQHPSAVPLLTATADLLDAVCERHPTFTRACMVLCELTQSKQPLCNNNHNNYNKPSGHTAGRKTNNKSTTAAGERKPYSPILLFSYSPILAPA
jgi:hypothetical protein